MKILKSLFILSILFLNILWIKPSLAEPNYTKNPDYIQLTQKINFLNTEKAVQEKREGGDPASVQKQIDELTFQKYALESGINWGQCTNQTGNVIGIYGLDVDDKDEELESNYGNQLYFLETGKTTRRNWDCDGIYLPAEATANLLNTDGTVQEIVGPIALKIGDGTQFSIKSNPETGVLEIDAPNAQLYKSGEINWFIPNVSQVAIDTRIPNAPIQKS